MQTFSKDYSDQALTDQYWCSIALQEAVKAYEKDEIPIGCVIVQNGKLLSRTHNLKESLSSPIAHAEILAIQQAAEKIGNWHLDDCTLYVTTEPCLMCTGAIIQSRIPRVVFCSKNPKGGGICSSAHSFELPGINHHPAWTSGILENSSSRLLKNYFKSKRKEKK